MLLINDRSLHLEYRMLNQNSQCYWIGFEFCMRFERPY